MVGTSSASGASPSGFLSRDGSCNAPRMLTIRGIEQCPRAIGANDRRPGDDGRHRPALDEQLGGPRFDRIGDRDGRDRRAWPDRGVLAGQRNEGVRLGRAEIDDEIGLVDEPAADRRVDVARRVATTDVTATTLKPRARAPRAISTGTAEVPPAENTTITSFGPNVKFSRICSARPGTRSMNIDWRWPFAPTTWVWNVIDSSTMGLKPG
jgi:hypothetical protein